MLDCWTFLKGPDCITVYCGREKRDRRKMILQSFLVLQILEVDSLLSKIALGKFCSC